MKGVTLGSILEPLYILSIGLFQVGEARQIWWRTPVILACGSEVQGS